MRGMLCNTYDSTKPWADFEADSSTTGSEGTPSDASTAWKYLDEIFSKPPLSVCMKIGFEVRPISSCLLSCVSYGMQPLPGLHLFGVALGV